MVSGFMFVLRAMYPFVFFAHIPLVADTFQSITAAVAVTRTLRPATSAVVSLSVLQVNKDSMAVITRGFGRSTPWGIASLEILAAASCMDTE